APVTVVVDRTPPTIVARTPGSGETNVSADEPITVQLSEPLAAASVTPTSVSVASGGVPVPATTALSADGKTLAVTLQGARGFPSVLTATLGAGLTDRAGNSIPSQSWSWTLPDWVALGDPLPASSGDPVLAIDGSGRIVVAYTGSDGTHFNN